MEKTGVIVQRHGCLIHDTESITSQNPRVFTGITNSIAAGIEQHARGQGGHQSDLDDGNGGGRGFGNQGESCRQRVEAIERLGAGEAVEGEVRGGEAALPLPGDEKRSKTTGAD